MSNARVVALLGVEAFFAWSFKKSYELYEIAVDKDDETLGQRALMGACVLGMTGVLGYGLMKVGCGLWQRRKDNPEVRLSGLPELVKSVGRQVCLGRRWFDGSGDVPVEISVADMNPQGVPWGTDSEEHFEVWSGVGGSEPVRFSEKGGGWMPTM